MLHFPLTCYLLNLFYSFNFDFEVQSPVFLSDHKHLIRFLFQHNILLQRWFECWMSSWITSTPRTPTFMLCRCCVIKMKLNGMKGGGLKQKTVWAVFFIFLKSFLSPQNCILQRPRPVLDMLIVHKLFFPSSVCTECFDGCLKHCSHSTRLSSPTLWGIK